MNLRPAVSTKCRSSEKSRRRCAASAAILRRHNELFERSFLLSFSRNACHTRSQSRAFGAFPQPNLAAGLFLLSSALSSSAFCFTAASSFLGVRRPLSRVLSPLLCNPSSVSPSCSRRIAASAAARNVAEAGEGCSADAASYEAENSLEAVLASETFLTGILHLSRRRISKRRMTNQLPILKIILLIRSRRAAAFFMRR